MRALRERGDPVRLPRLPAGQRADGRRRAGLHDVVGRLRRRRAVNPRRARRGRCPRARQARGAGRYAHRLLQRRVLRRRGRVLGAGAVERPRSAVDEARPRSGEARARGGHAFLLAAGEARRGADVDAGPRRKAQRAPIGRARRRRRARGPLHEPRRRRPRLPERHGHEDVRRNRLGARLHVHPLRSEPSQSSASVSFFWSWSKALSNIES